MVDERLSVSNALVILGHAPIYGADLRGDLYSVVSDLSIDSNQGFVSCKDLRSMSSRTAADL